MTVPSPLALQPTGFIQRKCNGPCKDYKNNLGGRYIPRTRIWVCKDCAVALKLSAPLRRQNFLEKL